jgi:Glycosyl hydrolases family 16
MMSNHYIFFGRVETWLKSAPGQGIVSSIVLESDDLDEIDWVSTTQRSRVLHIDGQSGVVWREK